MRRPILLLLYFSIGYFQLFAQTAIRDCGTPSPKRFTRIDPNMRQNEVQFTYPHTLKVFVTVFSDDNGTNVAAADTTVIRQLQNMRDFFSPHNICFVFAGIRRINNSDLNTHRADTEAGELSPLLVPGVMNIFVHTMLADTNGALNGYSYGIPSWYLSMAQTAIQSGSNRSTLAHEFGHNLGLVHTFENFDSTRIERVARAGDCSNCWDAGDGLCDTEADHENSVFDNNCNYTSGLMDGCNTPYNPNNRNIMSYGTRECRNMFTLGQGFTCRFSIENYWWLTEKLAPVDTVITFVNTVSTGMHFVLAKNSATVNPLSYVVNGDAQVRFAAKQIFLKPGTRFSPGTNGFVSIRPNDLCN